MNSQTNPARPINPSSSTELTGQLGSVPTLALVSAVAAAGFMIDALLGMVIPALAYDATPVWWDSVLRAVLHLGQIAAAVAVARAGLAGGGINARIGLGLWIFGVAGYVVGELVYIVAPGASDIAFQIGSIATLVGMVMAGVGVLRTGRWTGPGRYLPLVMGLYVIPLVVMLIATDAALVALTGYSVLWLLLGVSLYFTTRDRLRSRGGRIGSMELGVR
jgi:hypothetical protein